MKPRQENTIHQLTCDRALEWPLRLRHSQGIGTRGYLTFLEGFLGKMGQSYEEVSEEQARELLGDQFDELMSKHKEEAKDDNAGRRMDLPDRRITEHVMRRALGGLVGDGPNSPEGLTASSHRPSVQSTAAAPCLARI